MRDSVRILREHLFSPIIQFGPPRTGSTLVWNAIRTVCPGLQIPKRHNLSFLHRSSFCRSRFVVTVRNPLDIVASMLGVFELEPSPESINSKIDEIHRQGISDAIWLSTHPRSLILHYEEFYENFGHLFESLQTFLDCEAAAEDRAEFEKRFAINAVRQRAAALESFGRFDADDQIHGRHVSVHSGRPGYHAEIFDEEATARISSRFEAFMDAFGY